MPSSQPNHFIFAAPADFISDCVREGGARLPDDRPLPSMKEGDRIAFYAPRTAAHGGDRVEAFTAIGRVAAHVSPPTVTYDADASPAPIRPLLPRLDLTRLLGEQWQDALKEGSITVSAADFAVIARAMGADTLLA